MEKHKKTDGLSESNISLSLDGYRILFEHIQDGVFILRDEKFVYVNKIFSDILGYQAAELIGRSIESVIAPKDRTEVLDRCRKRLAGAKIPDIYELCLLHKSGSTLTALANVGITDKDESIILGTIKDVTGIRYAMNELEHVRQEYQRIRDTISDAFYRTDMNGVITDMSSACFSALGYRPEEMVGHKMSEFYVDPADRERVVSAIRERGGNNTQVEAAMRHRDGRQVWVLTNAYLLRDSSGDPCGIEGIARDISDRKSTEEELLFLSTHDDLTGSYNRRYFISAVGHEIERAKRYGSTLSFLLFDLDNFKTVNDTYGHPTGDALLQQFTALCHDNFRKSDLFARLGGEEFAALLPETDRSHAELFCERLVKDVNSAQFSDVEGKYQIRLTVSIGATTLLPDDRSFDQLYTRADNSLYRVKSSGRNGYRLDAPDMG